MENILSEKPLRTAVFLDRDGTINVEKDYLYRIEDFEFIPGAPEAIRKLKEAGFLVVVVTNQSGVARGYYSLEDVEILHTHIQNELKNVGALIDGFYICPHHPEKGVGAYRVDCDCRKGRPGMLLQAAEELEIDLSCSYMVGDKMVDVQAGQGAGCTSIMVKTGYGREESRQLCNEDVAVVDALPAAVDMILLSASA